MIVAVASGKGGTGKTSVAVALALVASEDEKRRVRFLDCDVEAPNAAIFLQPELHTSSDAGVLVPVVDEGRCNACGRCAEVCAYNAVTLIGKKVLVFADLCHGCGSCARNCPERAIREELSVLGVVEEGQSNGIAFAQGTLHVGHAMATPVIRTLKEKALASHSGDELVVLDAPPGTACPVVETLRRSDFVLLVTEPTPFGLHDLVQAVEVARDALGLPVGVVVNRDGDGDTGIEDYCRAEGIPVLMRIPLDRKIAEAYSDGRPLVDAFPEYRARFRDLLREIAVVAAK